MRLSEFVQPFIAEQEQRYPLTPEGRISAMQEAVGRLLYRMNPATSPSPKNPPRVMNHEERLAEAARMSARYGGRFNDYVAQLNCECIYPEEAAFRDALEPVDWSVPNPDPEVKNDDDSIAAVRARIRGTDCVFQGITSNNSDALADLFD